MLCIPMRYQSIFPGDSSDPNEAIAYSDGCFPKIKKTKTNLWVSQFKRCWARATDGWDFSKWKGELGMFKQSVHEIPSTSSAVNTRKRDNQVVAQRRRRWKRSLTIFLWVSTGQSWARLNAAYRELREKTLKTKQNSREELASLGAQEGHALEVSTLAGSVRLR